MIHVYVEIQDGRPVSYLTIAEYAKKLGVTIPAVRQYISRGKITTLKIGQEHWIHEDTIPDLKYKKGKKGLTQ